MNFMGVDVCTGSVEWIKGCLGHTFIAVRLRNDAPQFTHVNGSSVDFQ
jgi:hypothetical protein